MTQETDPREVPGPTADPDPLDETQPVEVPHYAPAPDPRPDTRWAWASPETRPAPDRWYQPAQAEPGEEPAPWTSSQTPTGSGPAWSGPVGTPGTTPPAWQATAPVAAAPQRRRGGPGIGTIVAASLLSAVIASGGTVLVLDRTGAFDQPAPISTVGQGQAASGQQSTGTSNTIDESSAVISSAAKVSPSVVKITTAGASTDPFGGTQTEGVGSGIIYDANGWILTNRHVVSGAQTLKVELKDGRSFDGKVYGIDTLTDLAIVKIDATGLPVASLGSSDELKVGQLVVAIGSPLGTYSFSVTSGIVSGKGRQITVTDSNGTQSRVSNLIQTDAAINPGNSGGPLADAAGNVVGINTAVATDSSGIGFAIPIDIAKPIMAQAVRGDALSRPWIGIRFQSIDPQVKQQLNLTVDTGAVITASGGTAPAVESGSPADKAGLKDGDVILSINGIVIDSEHPLDALLVQFSPGDTVQLSVLRGGQTITVPLTLGVRPGNLQ
jgi:S1-C subfamily serine protease